MIMDQRRAAQWEIWPFSRRKGVYDSENDTSRTFCSLNMSIIPYLAIWNHSASILVIFCSRKTRFGRFAGFTSLFPVKISWKWLKMRSKWAKTGCFFAAFFNFTEKAQAGAKIDYCILILHPRAEFLAILEIVTHNNSSRIWNSCFRENRSK